MAGHIAGLGYSQRIDINGRPLVGWKVAVYNGGTSTPSSVYANYALTVAATNPVVADANGMLPMFWLADGTYRVRGQDAQGNELFDDDGIVALGPSSGTGGSGTSVSATALLQTGDMLWVPISGTRTGWVRANARTIGASASGATERANSDCESLFLYLWQNFSDTLCPVTGGRGANAAADWSANKRIATLDMRGRAPFGLDDMGNSAASVIAAGTPTAAGSGTGAETVTLAEANLPSHTHGPGTLSGSTSTDGDHTHNYDKTKDANAGSGGNSVGDNSYISTATTSSGSHSHTVTITTGVSSATGSGTAVNKMPPYRLGTWFQKL